MKKIKKYPVDYSKIDLVEQISDYADQAVGSKSSDILVQEFAKASVGIAELQRRLARNALYISLAALVISVISVFVSHLSYTANILNLLRNIQQ